MLRHVAFMGATAMAITLGASAQAQSADTVVAKVGETEITLGEMIIIRASLPEDYNQLPDSVLFEGILDQMIEQQVLADTLDEIPDRVEYALANERRSLLAGEVIFDIRQMEISEETIAEAYAAQTDGVAEVEWQAAHLLVATEEEALAAKARVDGGEPFAAVARDVSTGPSGPNGGDLGWFTTGQMVPEFEAAVSEMEPGGVSDPVQTQFGWHIVTLKDRRTKAQPGLEEVRGTLTEQLRTQAVRDRIAELRAAAMVEMPGTDAIDPALLRNLELLEP